MELSIYQQIFDFFKRSGKILIVLPEHLSPDFLASGVALSLFLQKLEKEVLLICAGNIDQRLDFLPARQNVISSLPISQSLVVVLDTREKKLAELSYQTAADSVSIFLKAKEHIFSPDDISFTQEKFPADLIITIGLKTLPDAGKIFDAHTELFYETPKINIDNKAANELFGAVNLVDTAATSVAEVLSVLLEKYEEQIIDEDMATSLLTGIISATNSFQHVQTTPRAFLKASQLVALGGRQQEIIKNIFKTKPLALLKLWGRALARMKTLEEQSAVYSVLSFSDFTKAEATSAEIVGALKEFVDNVSAYKIIALITEAEAGNVKIFCALHPIINPADLVSALGEGVNILPETLNNFHIIEFLQSGLSLEQAEEKFAAAIKGFAGTQG